LQLLWYDADFVTRMRHSQRWQAFFEKIDQGRQTAARNSTPDANQTAFEVLAKAPLTEAKGIEKAFDDAIGEHEELIPPILLLASELELPFEEIEVLKAAMSAAVPLVASADERLKAALTIARDFLQTPGLSAAPATCERLTNRIREAFVAEKRDLAPDSIESAMQCVLLTGRHYQKRQVFGGSFVRCLMRLPGEPNPMVGYLPMDAATRLPLWKRFEARVIVEVHPAQDQRETCLWALKVLGIARASGNGG
jgi:hypothetical protein